MKKEKRKVTARTHTKRT